MAYNWVVSPVRYGTVAPKKRENSTASDRTMDSVKTRIPGAFKAISAFSFHGPTIRAGVESQPKRQTARLIAAGARWVTARASKRLWVNQGAGVRPRDQDVGSSLLALTPE